MMIPMVRMPRSYWEMELRVVTGPSAKGMTTVLLFSSSVRRTVDVQEPAHANDNGVFAHGAPVVGLFDGSDLHLHYAQVVHMPNVDQAIKANSLASSLSLIASRSDLS
jgi:hypothetical protein